MDIEGIYFLIQQVVEAKRSGEFLSPMFLEGQVHFVPCVVPVIEIEISFEGGPDHTGEAIGSFTVVGKGHHGGVAAAVGKPCVFRSIPAIQIGIGAPHCPARQKGVGNFSFQSLQLRLFPVYIPVFHGAACHFFIVNEIFDLLVKP